MRRAVTAGVLAVAAVLAGGCAGPRFAIPTARSPRVKLPKPAGEIGQYVVTNGALAYGRDEVAPGIWEEVVRLPLPTRGRAYWRRRGKLAQAPRAGHPLAFRRAPEPELQVADGGAESPADLRPAATTEIEDLQSLLHPLFNPDPARGSSRGRRKCRGYEDATDSGPEHGGSHLRIWNPAHDEVDAVLTPAAADSRAGSGFKKSVTARAWLAERVDLEALRLDLQHRLTRRAESAPPGSPSLLEALHTFYRAEQREIPGDERKLRRDSRIIGGLVGWERGNYSGLSWSAPFFLETHDEREKQRDLILFPFLSGGSSGDEGQTTVLGPLLSYSSDKATLDERSGGTMVLGTGRLFWESARKGRRELDIWPAASLITYRKPGQTWSFSPPTLAFYLKQKTKNAKKRWLVIPPLLAAFYRYETPATPDGLQHDRSFYFALGPLVMGDRDRVGKRERSRMLLVPLLGYRSSEVGENVPEGTEIVEPREESSTYLLGGIVHWGGKSPGLYRAKGVADARPRSVGDDESSWWFLPLVSYQADEQDDSSELMLWPLLGLGFGEEEGQSYVRLFYFWKIGGKG